MLSVSRPIEVVVLKDWVTLTKVTPLPVEHLDQLGEIHQRAAEAVDLVDDDDVDAAGLDVGEQPLQRRALQRAAGEAAVVVAVGHQHPAFGLLAGDVGLAGLALGVEAVELHVEAFLAGLAGVDRAAELADDRLLHARRSPVLQAEEDPAVPARAGDGAGDGRERSVGPALVLVVVVAHGHAVLDALPFADQPRAGDRPVVGAVWRRRIRSPPSSSSAERLEALDRLGLQPAIGQFLDAVGEPAFEEAAVVGRRLGLEELAPLLLQLRRSASSSAPPHRASTRVGHIRASLSLEDVGMTALVGREVERTFSAVGR